MFEPVMRVVGEYEILGEVAERGGMAVVYRARHRRLGRSAAIKQIDLRGGKDLVERFLREGRLAASLNHPNIVTVFDFFEYEGEPYIAMEYIHGGSLRPWIGHLTREQSAGVLEGVLAALAYAHDHGLVHRDVKPENVLVTTRGDVKLADFGVARAFAAATARLTATGMTVGTPAYMAPEQALDHDLGPWTDLYSTGVVAYEMLLGRLPFEQTETPVAMLLRHVNDPVPDPRHLDPTLDLRIASWLERMLAKQPDQRPASASAAWDELEDGLVADLGPVWRRHARLVERGGRAGVSPRQTASQVERPGRSAGASGPSNRSGEPGAAKQRESAVSEEAEYETFEARLTRRGQDGAATPHASEHPATQAHSPDQEDGPAPNSRSAGTPETSVRSETTAAPMRVTASAGTPGSTARPVDSSPTSERTRWRRRRGGGRVADPSFDRTEEQPTRRKWLLRIGMASVVVGVGFFIVYGVSGSRNDTWAGLGAVGIIFLPLILGLTEYVARRRTRRRRSHRAN